MAPQNDRTQYHGANVENHGGKLRLSQEQPRKRDESKKQIQVPPAALIGLGVLFVLIGILGGIEETPAIFPGFLFLGLGIALSVKKSKDMKDKTKPIRPERPLKPSSAQAIREERMRRQEQLEQERKQTIREKEKSSLSSSATYREHYPHKEKPQRPIDWDSYGQNVGPTREAQLAQAKRLLEAGLLDKDEYEQKCREIRRS